MEPQFTPPEFQNTHLPENEPVLPNQESGFDVLPSPETPLASPEQSKNNEQLSADHQGVTMPVIQQTVAIPVSDDQAQDTTTVVQTPTTARDEDTIEKEWISKVKSIISSTSDDPYKQQSMMSRLMADYVLKRYDRKIGEVKE